MGIDQVLVIPTMVIMHLPFAKSEEGVDVFCRAYNDFLVDWCGGGCGATVRSGSAAGAGSGAHRQGDLPGRGAWVIRSDSSVRSTRMPSTRTTTAAIDDGGRRRLR